MITLALICLSLLASCIAAAGLIASSLNLEDEARAMSGIQTGSDSLR